MADVISGIDTSAASQYTSTSSTDSTDALDKDAFLQLLVTQMQYQDPLNPSDSTQYMSQLAQYSSLEATMNISDTLEKGNSLNLVGQYVIMNTTDSSGETAKISGLVEYATVSGGEVMLSINDEYYPATDLDSVVDYDYYLYLLDQANKAEVTDTDVATDEEADDKTGTTGDGNTDTPTT